jgi:alanine racemase
MPDLHAPTAATEGVLRPTHLRVDLDQLAANYHALCAHVGGRPVMPILKANAYGHGLVPVARRLEAEGAPHLGVAYVEEGILLRRAGVRTPILVLGGILGDQVPLFIEHGLTITASSVDKLRAIDAAAGAMGRRATVHLKFDTGMERIGVHWYSADALGDAALAARHVDVEGVYSHLARSEDADPAFTRTQLSRFEGVLQGWAARGLRPRIRHLANSGAVLQHPDTWFDLVRPGISLYGVSPDPALPLPDGVRPALRWVSRVVYFKVVQPGNPVSYGSTWAPERMTRVVTVPVGYGDGYFRAMSGRARVLIGGRSHPVVGRICMDQLMVDIGWGEAFNGDEVVLLGAQGDACIRAEDLAAWADTIPYEVLTNINTRVPRVHGGGPGD